MSIASPSTALRFYTHREITVEITEFPPFEPFYGTSTVQLQWPRCVISRVLRYILYMITAEDAVYVLYRTHATRGYWPTAVYSTCDQFTVDPLLAGIKPEFQLDPLYQQPKAEFILDPLYQQPKSQFQPEAPLRDHHCAAKSS